MFCQNYWVIRHVWYNNKKKENILLTKDWIFGAVYFFLQNSGQSGVF